MPMRKCNATQKAHRGHLDHLAAADVPIPQGATDSSCSLVLLYSSALQSSCVGKANAGQAVMSPMHLARVCDDNISAHVRDVNVL